MPVIFYGNIKKKKFNIISILLFLAVLYNEGAILGADISVGTAVIANQCSSLGSNNPLRLLDCSIFKISKGMCCMLTITLSEFVTDEDTGIQSYQESYKTACIILEKYDAAVIKKATNDYKKLGGDVLIECKQNYISVLYIYFILFAFICIFWNNIYFIKYFI